MCPEGNWGPTPLLEEWTVAGLSASSRQHSLVLFSRSVRTSPIRPGEDLSPLLATRIALYKVKVVSKLKKSSKDTCWTKIWKIQKATSRYVFSSPCAEQPCQFSWANPQQPGCKSCEGGMLCFFLEPARISTAPLFFSGSGRVDKFTRSEVAAAPAAIATGATS